MRDRLFELFSEFRITCPNPDAPCDVCKYDRDGTCDTEGRFADHLLSNGVIVPPVAVSGAMYTINRGRAKKWKVCFIGLNTRGEIKFHLADEGFKTMIEAWNYDIGKTVFLTREEAEKALKEREGKG